MKRKEPYNLYSIRGKEWRNVSIDYSSTVRNFHLFGEIAVDKLWHYAFINGVISSLSKNLDIASILRYISSPYQSVFGNAFTENTMPGNENGVYLGVSFKPHINWKMDLYADLFSFPWLKYRLDAPSGGVGYLVQLTWKPNKQTEMYSRFRYRIKPLNIDNEEEFTEPGIQTIQNWRTHFSRQLSRSILLRSRIDLCLFTQRYLNITPGGFLSYADVVYKPMRSWFSGNIRLQVFEADNYDTRIYAYENDLLFVSSTRSFYNNGVRGYMNLKAKTKVKFLSNSMLNVNLKVATTVYNNISYLGSGPSKIPGNRVSSIKLQIFLTGN